MLAHLKIWHLDRAVWHTLCFSVQFWPILSVPSIWNGHPVKGTEPLLEVADKYGQLKCIFNLMLPAIKIMSLHSLNNHFWVFCEFIRQNQIAIFFCSLNDICAETFDKRKIKIWWCRFLNVTKTRCKRFLFRGKSLRRSDRQKVVLPNHRNCVFLGQTVVLGGN